MDSLKSGEQDKERGDGPLRLSEEQALSLLLKGRMASPKLTPYGSNYTFLVAIEPEEGQGCWAIYKPQRGEAPLWDFPPGTLYKREYAAYVLSRALGWPNVPPTVIRDGVHGIGSVQLFIDAEPSISYLQLRETHLEELKRMAAFDWLANNADRKGGHCLLGRDGRVWSIDHGLTFHDDYKLRTIIWDFQGSPVPAPLLDDLNKLLGELSSPGELAERLASMLAQQEMTALVGRLCAILKDPVYPLQHHHRSVPWPWV